MKTLIFFSFCFAFFPSISFSQRVYYVQDKAYNTNASDMNMGTDINLPWATWQRAFNTAKAGDTVFFRGGEWYPETKARQGYPITSIDPEAGYGHNGTYNNPICFFAYPPDYESGNVPILDGNLASSNTTGNTGIGITNASYLKFKGLTVRHIRMLHPDHNVIGISIGNCFDGPIWLENMTAHHIGGAGMWARGYDSVYFTNCDVYNCCDSLDTTSPGGDGDGFAASSRGVGPDTTYFTSFHGCRAWNCSDDGFDIGTTKQISILNCWSWNNGNFGDYSGDGVGFKFSYSAILDPTKRNVTKNITAYNRTSGIKEVNLYDEQFGPVMLYYNNVSYKEMSGFGTGDSWSPPDLKYYKTIASNNIIYDYSGTYPAEYRAAEYTHLIRGISYVTLATNTWRLFSIYGNTEPNPAFTVTDDDFISLDTAQLRWSRKQDGSLPDISFMNLKDGSDMIDTGTDVGMPFNGTAPDLGAFESNTVPGSSNIYPTIALIAPLNKSTITNFGNLIVADANDPDGSISKVEFFCDGILIGEANSYPWSFTWDNAPLGNHTLRAVATDNQSAQATSARIEITIYPGGLNNMSTYILFPNPNNGSFYVYLNSPLKRTSNVSIITSDGKIVCNDFIAAEERFKQFNMPFLKPGIYLFMLASSEIYFAKKFVKQ